MRFRKETKVKRKNSMVCVENAHITHIEVLEVDWLIGGLLGLTKCNFCHCVHWNNFMRSACPGYMKSKSKMKFNCQGANS